MSVKKQACFWQRQCNFINWLHQFNDVNCRPPPTLSVFRECLRLWLRVSAESLKNCSGQHHQRWPRSKGTPGLKSWFGWRQHSAITYYNNMMVVSLNKKNTTRSCDVRAGGFPHCMRTTVWPPVSLQQCDVMGFSQYHDTYSTCKENDRFVVKWRSPRRRWQVEHSCQGVCRESESLLSPVIFFLWLKTSLLTAAVRFYAASLLGSFTSHPVVVFLWDFFFFLS